MRTIIVTSLATTWSVPLLLGFALTGRGLMWRVLYFLDENTVNGRRQKTALTAAIWLFALFSTAAALAPASLSDRTEAVVMMAFLTQAGITDAISGYLPRTFTARLLLAGLLWGMAQDVPDDVLQTQLLETAAMGVGMVLLGALANRGIQRLGLGDLWLITGLTAWMGIKYATLATLCGAAAFALWLMTWHLSGKKEGPLGPWLCLSGSLFQLSHLYQPVWISIL